MARFNVRFLVSAITILVVLVYYIVFQLQHTENGGFFSYVTPVPITITIIVFIGGLFIVWAWKWNFFYSWLVLSPDLSGVWEGSIKSNWQNGQLDAIPITVIISQTFLSSHIEMKTAESRSQSVGSFFVIDNDRNTQQLSYIYLNHPNASVRARSEIHYGAVMLNFDVHDKSKMDGNYWTDRGTAGEINIVRLEQEHKSRFSMASFAASLLAFFSVRFNHKD